jgi:mediator of RNA polymerase II transcription subunit 14
VIAGSWSNCRFPKIPIPLITLAPANRIPSNPNTKGPRINSVVPLSFKNEPPLDGLFFTGLTTYVPGTMSGATDLSEIRKRGRHFAFRNVPNPHLPPGLHIPEICVRLSEILPSTSKQGGIEATAKRPKPWGRDAVYISYQGLRWERVDEAQRWRKLVTVHEARLHVTDRSKFSLLGSKVDDDVFYDPRTGEFRLYLRADVGKSIMKPLESRLRAIDRLLGFLDSIRKQNGGIKPEEVTLRRLVFTYGSSAPVSAGDAPAIEVKRYKAVLDLATHSSINVILEPGNPHNRVLDYLNLLVNDSNAFPALPEILLKTLPLHRAIDRMEDNWEDIQMAQRAQLHAFPRTADWLTLRFALPPLAPPAPGTPVRPRNLHLDVRLRARNGEKWWFVTRAAQAPDAAEDEFARALKKVWDARGARWKALGTGAAARMEEGVEELFAAVDEVVRAIVPARPIGVRPPMAPQQAGAAGRPAVPPMQGQGMRPGQSAPQQRPPAGPPVVDLT